MPEHTHAAAMTTPTTAEQMMYPCTECRGQGTYLPYCFLCEDSGEGHACPTRQTCETCKGTGKLPDRRKATSELADARATIARLEGELEVERMCLAACAVAAWGGEVRDTLSPYDSDSLRAVVALRTRADAAERRVEAVTKGLHAVAALINDSHGVVGLHMNGDIATWEDLRTGGSFEEWLREFDAALAAASGVATALPVCSECHGDGYITVSVCCGHGLGGECCSDPEPSQEPCPKCGTTTEGGR